jgi:formylglycine-generating enzyme required for sulfatase activity
VHPDNPIAECLEDNCPQGNATSYQMFAYTNRLSEMEGFEPCYLIEGDGSGCTGDGLETEIVCPTVKINGSSPYECEGYRLPMEAEWEYAARAGTLSSFPTGNITPQGDDASCFFDAALDAIGWYCKNALEKAQPVALKPPNGWGLHDMHGNVMEFVNDAYGPLGYLNGPYGLGEGPLTDPTGVANLPNDITITGGPDRAYARVIRGGSHLFSAVVANVSRRNSRIDIERGPYNGFRVVRTRFEDQEGSP